MFWFKCKYVVNEGYNHLTKCFHTHSLELWELQIHYLPNFPFENKNTSFVLVPTLGLVIVAREKKRTELRKEVKICVIV